MELSELSLKEAWLRVRLEGLNGFLASVSVQQVDGTVMGGFVPREDCNFQYESGELVSYLKVVIIKEKFQQALISWPVQCGGDECSGDEFWVNRDLLKI